MAFLNFFADITVVMPFAWPWEMLLNGGFTFIASVAWRIVFLTVCLKLLLSPLDFYQRYKMRKNQLITKRLAPQIEKLQQQYAGNEKVLQNKKMELSRKAGVSTFSSCLPMIVTLIVFIWLWQSLNNVAQYNQFRDYVNMYEVYESVYSDSIGESDIDVYAAGFREEYNITFAEEYKLLIDADETPDVALDGAADAALIAASAVTEATESYDALYKDRYIEWFVSTFEDYSSRVDIDKAVEAGSQAGRMNATEVVSSYCRTLAQRETYNYYYNYGDYAEGGSKADQAYKMESFLWLKNVWTADVPWTAPIKSSASEFKSAVGDWATNTGKSGLEKAELNELVEMYDTVTAFIHSDESNAVNGWLILPVLALILNLFTQMITRRQQKKSGQTQMTEGQSGCMMKVMMFALPVMMFFFAIQYCAVFTLYMVTNALMSLVINLITTMLSKRMLKDGGAPQKTVSGGTMVERYGRPDPNSKDSGVKSDSAKPGSGYNKNKNRKR